MKRILALIMAMSMLTLVPWSSGAVIGAPAPSDATYQLYGFVSDTAGGVLANVTISLVDETGNITMETLTNVTGAYNFTVPQGNYNLTASLVNHTANTTYTMINITQAVQGPYNFTMSEVLGAVTGFVTDGEMPIYNVVVTLSNVDYTTYTGITTMPLGQYAISGLKPGYYTAYAVKHGYDNTSTPVPFIIERGMTKVINFTMQEQPARVYGTVYGEGDNPLSGVKVELVSSEYSASAITDEKGNYSISSIPVNDYTISFTYDGYYDRSSSIGFDPFESKRMDVSLDRVKKNATAVLFGYDLAHSAMIVGFVVGLVIIIGSIFINIRAQKRPEILVPVEKDDEEEKE